MTYIRGVLVLGEQGDVQEDGQRGRVGSKDDDLSSTTVKSFGSLVGSLLELTVVASRLDQVQDFLSNNHQFVVGRAALRMMGRTWDRAASAIGQAADSFWLDMMIDRFWWK